MLFPISSNPCFLCGIKNTGVDGGTQIVVLKIMSSNLYSNIFHFFNTSDRHLWQLNTVVFSALVSIIRAVLLQLDLPIEAEKV